MHIYTMYSIIDIANAVYFFFVDTIYTHTQRPLLFLTLTIPLSLSLSHSLTVSDIQLKSNNKMHFLFSMSVSLFDRSVSVCLCVALSFSNWLRLKRDYRCACASVLYFVKWKRKYQRKDSARRLLRTQWALSIVKAKWHKFGRNI